MDIKFYNSLTKQEEVFLPAEQKLVRIYNCGPTVYKRPHLGNMRRFLFADLLRRSLEFFGWEVREIMNLTDVGHLTEDDLDTGQDKLEREAARRQITPSQIASLVTSQFLADSAELNIQRADAYPKATEHIEEMQSLIKLLLERGHAYQTKHGIYFSVQTFPNYGTLSGNSVERLSAGARVDVRKEKKHPADFALWITNDPTHLQQWDSPWGKGYPGWHIECSAMSLKYLGSQIDIHTGGEDNKFPHHENEIAQSEGATGKPFVRFWLHNSHLVMKGEKLAKRHGEQITVETLTQKGFSPLAFRWFVLGAHYRTKLEFSWEEMGAAEQNLETIKTILRRIKELNVRPAEGKPEPAAVEEFGAALANDLNSPQALAVFWRYLKQVNQELEAGPDPEKAKDWLATLNKLDQVMGVVAKLQREVEQEQVPPEVQKLIQQREKARKNQLFAEADQLRQDIEKLGYGLEDFKGGTRAIKN